jgi:hypothetical protein
MLSGFLLERYADTLLIVIMLIAKAEFSFSQKSDTGCRKVSFYRLAPVSTSSQLYRLTTTTVYLHCNASLYYPANLMARSVSERISAITDGH